MEYHSFVWPAYGHGRISGLRFSFEAAGLNWNDRGRDAEQENILIFSVGQRKNELDFLNQVSDNYDSGWTVYD